jgi:hypothetical protein
MSVESRLKSARAYQSIPALLSLPDVLAEFVGAVYRRAENRKDGYGQKYPSG